MLRLFTLFLSLILLNACSYIHPYHAPLQQGNIINADAVAQLRTGMTSQQVVELMGTPVLKTLFNNEQFAYIYTFKPNNGPLVYKRVILTFKDNRVIMINKYPENLN